MQVEKINHVGARMAREPGIFPREIWKLKFRRKLSKPPDAKVGSQLAMLTRVHWARSLSCHFIGFMLSVSPLTVTHDRFQTRLSLMLEIVLHVHVDGSLQQEVLEGKCQQLDSGEGLGNAR